MCSQSTSETLVALLAIDLHSPISAGHWLTTIMLPELSFMVGHGQAIAATEKLAFASSSNILCADVSGGAASLEISPDGLQVRPMSNAGALLPCLSACR